MALGNLLDISGPVLHLGSGDNNGTHLAGLVINSTSMPGTVPGRLGLAKLLGRGNGLREDAAGQVPTLRLLGTTQGPAPAR